MVILRSSFAKQVLFYVSLIILVFLSFIPRSVEVLNKNYLFLFDQGRDYQAVRNIVVDRKITLIGPEIGAGSAGFSYVFHGPGYYYLLSLPFYLTNGDPYSGVFTMWLLGLSVIIFSYFFGNKLFGKFGGLIFALGIASSTPLIWQSRFVWNSYPSTIFILLVFYCIYNTYKGKGRYWFFAAFFAGFIYHFELAIAVPLCLAVGFFALIIFRLRQIKNYFLIIAGYILAFSPMMLFEARHSFQGTKNLVSYIFTHHPTTVSQPSLFSFWPDHIQSFLANIAFSFPLYPLFPFIPGEPAKIIVPLFLITVAYVLYQEKDKARKRLLWFLISLPFITFFVFAFLRNSVWQHYLYALNVDYILLFTFALVLAFTKKHGPRLLFGIVGCLLLGNALISAVTVFRHEYYDYGGHAKIKGKTEALDYIYRDAKGEKFGLLVFSPPIYTYPYDYLTWWYGKRKTSLGSFVYLKLLSLCRHLFFASPDVVMATF